MTVRQTCGNALLCVRLEDAYLKKMDLFRSFEIVPSSFLNVHFSKVTLLPAIQRVKKLERALSRPLYVVDATTGNPVPEK